MKFVIFQSKFAETIPELGRMKSFIQSTQPILVTDSEFEVFVSNTLQEKDLIKLKPQILDYIRQKVQNDLVTMNIKLAEETETQRANTPEERFRILSEKNPALDILKNGLQLEID